MPIRWQTTINPDLGPVLARFATSNAVLMNGFRVAMMQSANELRSELSAATPRGRGASVGKPLADAWTVTDQGFQFRVANTEGRKLYYVVKGNDYPHGGGSADGYIYPKSSQFLRFEINGETIFARRVKATAPRDFVRPLLDSWKVSAHALFATTFTRHSRWLAGKG